MTRAEWPTRDDAEPPITETTTEARAGSTPGVTRYVLIFGLLLVVIILCDHRLGWTLLSP